MRAALPIRTGALYAAGDVGTSLTSLCLGFFWLYFLIDVAGLPPLEAGLVQGSGYVVSAAVTLAAGAWLDRHPGKRVRTGVIAGAGTGMAISFALVWIVPPLPAWRAPWYLVCSWAFHAQFAFVYLEYLSIARRVTAAGSDRVQLNGWRFTVTMILTLALLAFHASTDGVWPIGTRLRVLGTLVAIVAAVSSVICGIGFRDAPPLPDTDAAASRAPWRDLAASRVLWWSVGANLAVWFVVQTALVLTVFLSAAAGVNHASVLLTLQGSAAAAMILVGLAARRVSADVLLTLAMALCWAGAVLWLPTRAMPTPFLAAAGVGAGIGAATVLTWTRVSDALDRYAAERRDRADARLYAGLVVLRDLVAATIPPVATAAMTHMSGPVVTTGAGAAALLLLNVSIAAIVLIALQMPAARPAGGAGTAAAPTRPA